MECIGVAFGESGCFLWQIQNEDGDKSGKNEMVVAEDTEVKCQVLKAHLRKDRSVCIYILNMERGILSKFTLEEVP